MNRKSKRLAARCSASPKVVKDKNIDIEERDVESDSDKVVENLDIVGSNVVGEKISSVIPVDISLSDGVVTVAATSTDSVVADVVVDVVTEEGGPLVRGGHDVVGDAETEVVGEGAIEENNERRGRMKVSGEDMAVR